MPRWSLFILFAFISISIQLLIHYYIWRRLVRDTRVPHPWRRVMTISIVLLGLSMPMTMWLSRLLGIHVGPYSWPTFLWLGMAVMLMLGFLLIDGLRILRWSARQGIALARGTKPEQIDHGRRQFFARMAGGAVVAGATGTVGVGMRAARSDIQVNEVPVTLPRLPAALDGFAIVQLTDIHVGFTVTRSFIEGLVERANAAKPDLIVITGDLVDGTVADLADGVEPLGQLRAPHGVYFVTGNHEYYAGVDPWLDELRRLGIRVLRNERVQIGTAEASFDLAGIDDYQAAEFGNGHGADLARAVAGRDPSRELVLLAHQPRMVHEAKRHGVGLQISGHTHGGQIWPWHYLVRIQQGGLLAGLSRHDDTQLFISRGTGYWGPPLRVGAPAEIARIVLRALPQA